MSTISTNDDPSAAVQGGIELTEAIIGAIAGKLSSPESNSPDPGQENPTLNDADWNQQQSEWDNLQQAPALKDSELVPALLEKIPEEDRGKVTIQIGSSKVLKPGGEPTLNESQAKTLRTLLDDPTKVNGTIKMYDDGGNHFLKVSNGEVHYDLLDILPQQPIENIFVTPESPTITVAPEAVKQDIEPLAASSESTNQNIQAVEKAIAPGDDQQALIDTISRLESRVAELEQKITQSPMKLGDSKIGAWMNGIRNNIAAQLHQTTEKIAQRVHEVADKISVTTTEKVNGIKDSVAEKVDDIKQNVAETVSDVRENVTDGLNLARDLTVTTVNDVIDAGMERHNEAVAEINKTAQDLVNSVKQAVEDPRQAYIDKVANPTVQRMFEVAEKIPNRVTTDEQGNKNLNVGTYQYQLSQSGDISVSRAGEQLTAANLTSKDVAAIQEMKQVISPKQTEQIKQTQKIEPPKPKIKMSV
jgi:hypothetical protein